MRRRIRMYIWNQWKKPKRVRNVKILGVPADKVYEWRNTRLGYWRIAGSSLLIHAITNKKFALAGPDIMTFRANTSDYENSMQTIETPYTERYVRCCERSVTQLMGDLLLDFIRTILVLPVGYTFLPDFPCETDKMNHHNTVLVRDKTLYKRRI